ncbi:unnamed protein product [Umbelopsis vinacea]
MFSRHVEQSKRHEKIVKKRVGSLIFHCWTQLDGMGNETSKAKMEAFQNNQEQHKHKSTHIPQKGAVADRTDTMSSGNSADSDSKLKRKRKPFKTAKEFLLSSNKTPWSQEKLMYRSDQACSNCSLQFKSTTDDSIDGTRTSFSSTNITVTGSEQNFEDDEATQIAERGCHAGHELMRLVFTLDTYQALFQRLFLAPVEDYLRSGAQVLHIGCGAGDWSVEMAKRYTDVTFHAVDTVCSTPSSRQQRHFPKNVNVTAVRGGLDNLPFGDQSFDFVMCRFLSFRIQNWRSLIDEMIRLTKAGCYIEVCEPDFVSVGEPGTASRLLFNSLSRMMLADGRDPWISEKLEDLLSQSESLLFVSSQAALISLSSHDVAQNLFAMTANQLGRYLTDWKPPGVALDKLMAQYVRESTALLAFVAAGSVSAEQSVHRNGLSPRDDTFLHMNRFAISHNPLDKRQSACPSGDFACSDGNGCCPIGSTCSIGTSYCNIACGVTDVRCADGGCCKAGTYCGGDGYCYSTGSGSGGSLTTSSVILPSVTPPASGSSMFSFPSPSSSPLSASTTSLPAPAVSSLPSNSLISASPTTLSPVANALSGAAGKTVSAAAVLLVAVAVFAQL